MDQGQTVGGPVRGPQGQTAGLEEAGDEHTEARAVSVCLGYSGRRDIQGGYGEDLP